MISGRVPTIINNFNFPLFLNSFIAFNNLAQITLIVMIAQIYKLFTLLYIDLEMSVVLKLTNIPSFFPVSLR